MDVVGSVVGVLDCAVEVVNVVGCVVDALDCAVEVADVVDVVGCVVEVDMDAGQLAHGRIFSSEMGAPPDA